MYLSSLRRLRMFCAGQMTVPITSNTTNNRLLSTWLATVSLQIENYLNRHIEKGTYTEYFDIPFNKKEFFVTAPPVTAFTSVYMDSTGLWDGGEAEVSNCFIGQNERSICTQRGFTYEAKKALRIIYTGGLAAHAVNSTFTLTSITGTFTAGNFVIGQSSGAVGLAVSYTAGTKALVVENYYGIFQVGEVVKAYDNEDGTGSATATDTISAIAAQSLAEAYTPIVTATEAQIRFMWKHTTDFENSGTNKDGTTMRRGGESGALPLQPEVINLLGEYRRLLL